MRDSNGVNSGLEADLYMVSNLSCNSSAPSLVEYADEWNNLLLDIFVVETLRKSSTIARQLEAANKPVT